MPVTMISFPYDPWDPRKDILPERPGSPLAYSAVITGHFPDAPKGGPEREMVLDAITKTIAGALELLRSAGIPAAEIQNRVKSFLREADSHKHQVLRKANSRTREVSDPENLRGRLDKNKYQVRR